MAVVEVLFLDHVLKVGELVHSASVGAEALLKEAAGSAALVELQEIHGAALVWGPAGNLVDDFLDKLDPLSA